MSDMKEVIIEIESWANADTSTGVFILKATLDRWLEVLKKAEADAEALVMATEEQGLRYKAEQRVEGLEGAFKKTMEANPECPLCRAGMAYGPNESRNWWKINHSEECDWKEALAANAEADAEAEESLYVV